MKTAVLGGPAAGIHVSATPGGDSSWLRERWQRTDADGRARFDELGAGANQLEGNEQTPDQMEAEQHRPEQRELDRQQPETPPVGSEQGETGGDVDHADIDQELLA